jgi:acetyl esterase
MKITCLSLFLYFWSSFTFAQMPTIAQVREAMSEEAKKVLTPLEEVFRTEVRTIKNGKDSVAIQIYYPNDQRNLPIIYNIHGGAFIVRALDENIARILCNQTGSVVVSVNYRVAPEYPFPASIEDCYAVWQWISQNAKKINGDSKKIILVGNSAGGNFTSALQVKRQLTSKPKPPIGLVLINPGVDLRPTAPGADYYSLVVNWYLNGADPSQPLVSPILDTNLKNYPRTLIVTCQKDEIRQHGITLSERLKVVGVNTQLVDLPELPHLGPDWGAATTLAKPAIEATISFINSLNKK